MKREITIGHFPILDHLILGVAEHNSGGMFENFNLHTKLYKKWDNLSGDLRDGKIDGAFLLFPIASELFRKGASIKLVLLGHREGQVLVAQNGIEKVEDLKGKTIFVPDRFSTHHILLYQILKKSGMNMSDVVLKMDFNNPREIVDKLESNEVQAFISAEPMGTQVVQNKTGTIIATSDDIQTHHVDCVLVLRNELLSENEKAVQELIEVLVNAGMFVTAYPRQAAEIGSSFLEWPKKILIESLTHHRGHILFWDLLPRVEEFEEIQNIAVDEMHLWEDKIDMDSFIEPHYASKAYREWMIDTRKNIKDRGKKRTLPASFKETRERFKNHFGNSIDVAGFSFIRKGQKYFSESERINNVSVDFFSFFESIFEGKEITLKTESPSIKGIVFLKDFKNHEPDRILLRLTKEQALLCLKVLSWGEENNSIKVYDEETAEKDLLASKLPFIFCQKGDVVIGSINIDVFRFLPLVAVYFSKV